MKKVLNDQAIEIYLTEIELKILENASEEQLEM